MRFRKIENDIKKKKYAIKAQNMSQCEMLIGLWEERALEMCSMKLVMGKSVGFLSPAGEGLHCNRMGVSWVRDRIHSAVATPLIRFKSKIDIL